MPLCFYKQRSMAKITKKQVGAGSFLSYRDFVHDPPVLYGWIVVNGKSKVGSFRTRWDKYAGFCYCYYTERGNRGSGGFTLGRAYDLYRSGFLSTDPEKGKSSAYIRYK